MKLAVASLHGDSVTIIEVTDEEWERITGSKRKGGPVDWANLADPEFLEELQEKRGEDIYNIIVTY